MADLHAVILAAGRGQRLSPLTDGTSKVLLEVGGRPVIEHALHGLAAAGAASVTVVTGHCANQVVTRVGQFAGALAVRCVHNPGYAQSNNIVSLALALDALPMGSDLLLLEGDVLLDPALIARLAACGAPDAALVADWLPGMDGTLAGVAQGRITSLVMGDDLAALVNRSHYAKTVNVTKLSAATLDHQLRPAIARWIERGATGEFYEAVLANLIAEGTLSLAAIAVGALAWAEIDDAHDLDRARYLFAAPGERRAMLDRSFGGYWNYPVLDFAYPQNVHFPPPAVKHELATMLPTLLGRYGSAQALLDEKLARFLQCPAQEVVLLNGLSQIFPWLAAHFGHAPALIPQPGFGEYARVWPGAATYADCGVIDLDGLGAVEAEAIVLVNPNNPSGTAVSSAEILALAKAKTHTLFIVDESFADFSQMPSLAECCGDLLPPNVLLLKSLGKALGASGLRLGYARASAPGLIESIRRALPVWNSNALAEAYLEILPKHRAAFAISLRQTCSDRETMRAALAGLRLVAEVWPSHANFLLVRLDLDPADRELFLDHLIDRHGIYVKDVTARMPLPGVWLRLSVRSESDNQRLYAALSDTASSAATHL